MSSQTTATAVISAGKINVKKSRTLITEMTAHFKLFIRDVNCIVKRISNHSLCEMLLLVWNGLLLDSACVCVCERVFVFVRIKEREECAST